MPLSYRPCRVIALMTAFVFGAHPTRAAGPEPSEAATLSQGDQGAALVKYAQEAAREGFSGAFLAAVDGKVVAAAGVGFSDPKHTTPNTPATLFEIASITKQFTAAAVLVLQQDGKLELTDSISKHLPGVPEDCSAIQVEHLLRHTSGIPGSNSEGYGTNLAKVLPTFLKGGPLYTPGTHWEYWNQGYALLSEVIARASGESYVDFCRERLFAPAGMTATCFTGDAAPAGFIAAIGHASRGGRDRSALDHPYVSYGFQYRGMGGVVTTVWDLWRWDRVLAAQPHADSAIAPAPKPVLSEKSISQLFNPGPGLYGLGWFVGPDSRKRPMQSHGGGVRGFVSELRRYPARDGFIVVLCNTDSYKPHKLADGLAALLFGDAEPPAIMQMLDKAAAAGLNGEYTGTHRGRALTLTVEQDGVIARLEWGKDGPVTRARLVTDDGGVMYFDDGAQPLAVTLTRNDDASIRSLSFQEITLQRTTKP